MLGKFNWFKQTCVILNKYGLFNSKHSRMVSIKIYSLLASLCSCFPVTDCLFSCVADSSALMLEAVGSFEI
jgi:hypothetical protein